MDLSKASARVSACMNTTIGYRRHGVGQLHILVAHERPRREKRRVQAQRTHEIRHCLCVLPTCARNSASNTLCAALQERLRME